MASDVVLHDTEIPGFHCKVTPKGRRVYMLYYRTRDGQERRPKIGIHGEVTCDQARTIARDWKAEVAKGGDPSATKKSARTAPTVADLCERYVTEHAEPHKKPSSVRDDRRMIEKHILPELGARKVKAVTTEDVGRVHHRLQKTPYLANHVRALLSKMFNLAEGWGLRTAGTNPTRHVQKYKEAQRERFLNDDEIERLWYALESGEEAPQAVTAIKLLLLTGCRMGEILTLRWDDIDWDRGVLRLRDTKTGASKRYVGEPVLDLLRGLPWRNESPWVIPGANLERHWVNLAKSWGRIRERAGLTGARLHDLRHTHASTAAGLGLSLPMIGKLLGHTQAATTQRYAHLAEDPVRRAADLVSGRLAPHMRVPKENRHA